MTPKLVLTCAHVVGIPDRHGSLLRSEQTVLSPAREFRVLEETFLAAEDLVLLQVVGADASDHALLAEVVAPGDELWTYGYPLGEYRSGDSAALRLDGESRHVDGASLLRVSNGRIRQGFSGGPVLNWRTGAVCGLLRLRSAADVARLVPIAEVFTRFPVLARWHAVAARNRTWLDLLDDTQLAANGVPYPGPAVRALINATASLDARHPYAELLGVTPPLSDVYLSQLVHERSGTAAEGAAEPSQDGRLQAETLADHVTGAQVVGVPGAGKSSLAQRITATSARQWITDASGPFVAVMVPAEALTDHRRQLHEQLASGILRFIDPGLDHGTLVSILNRQPVCGLPWLVLVDGLDEIVNPQMRDFVLAKVNRFRNDTHARYRFIVTTRPLHDVVLQRVMEPKKYPTFVIEEFQESELRDFAENWFDKLGVSGSRALADEFMAKLNATKIGEIATIPLIATMMCITFARNPDRALPFNRAQLYAQFTDLILAKHRKLLDVRGRLRQWMGPSGQEAEAGAEHTLEDVKLILLELAHQRSSEPTSSMLDTVPLVQRIANSSLVPKPKNVSLDEWVEVVSEIMRSSGLLIEDHGDFRFLHQTIEEYFAAVYLATKHSDPRRRQARRLVAPKPWPWQDVEVRTFLIARWTAEDGDLRRIFRKLLSRRNWSTNYEFLIELDRQGVPLPCVTRHRLVDLLRRRLLSDARGARRDWLAALHALSQLDENVTAITLQELAARVDHPGELWFDAVSALIRLRPELGVAALERFVEDGPTGMDRLRAARMLVTVDKRRGLRVLADLAQQKGMADLRVEAALAVAGLSRDWGIELLQLIAHDTGETSAVRLTATRVLAKYDESRAWETLSGIGKERGVDARETMAAILELESLDTARALESLVVIASSRAQPSDVRLALASAVIDRDAARGLDILTAMVTNVHEDNDVRGRAAAVVGRHNPAAGLQLSLKLLADTAMGDERIAVGRRAGELDPAVVAAALAALAMNGTEPNGTRVDAARLAAELDKPIGLTALTQLARRHDDVEIRIKAATAAGGVERVAGAELLAVVANDPSVGHSKRRSAGVMLYRFDRSAAITALTNLADAGAGIDHRRLAAADLARLNRAAGTKVLTQLASSPKLNGPDRLATVTLLTQFDRDAGIRQYEILAKDPLVDAGTRRKAAQTLQRMRPDKKTFKVLTEMGSVSTSNDGSESFKSAKKLVGRNRSKGVRALTDLSRDSSASEANRFAAAELAAKHDKTKGGDALRALANDSKASRETRAKARRARRKYSD